MSTSARMLRLMNYNWYECEFRGGESRRKIGDNARNGNAKEKERRRRRNRRKREKVAE